MQENNIPVLSLHIYNLLHFPITVFVLLPGLWNDLTSRNNKSVEGPVIAAGTIILYLLALSSINIVLSKRKTSYPVFITNLFTVIRGMSLLFNIVTGLVLLFSWLH